MNLVDSQRKLLQERIETLEKQLINDQDLISSLRTRINNLSQNTFPKEIKNNKSNNVISELSPDTMIQFLKNNPLILHSFLNKDYDPKFFEIASNISLELIPNFYFYSCRQIERFSICFEIFKNLTNNINEKTFPEIITQSIRKLFTSSLVFTFLLDSKSGEFFTFFDLNSLFISLKDTVSIISTVAKSKKVTIINKPNDHPDFSSSLDPLFNPDNLSELIIPISDNSIILVLHTDTNSFDFLNEDILIGTFLSNLLQPLIREHLESMNLLKEVDLRKFLRHFEIELSTKVTFNELLPFLVYELHSNLYVNDVELFIVCDTGFYSFEFIDSKLIQKNHKKLGIPSYIIDNKQYVISNNLNIKYNQYFDS